MDGEQPYTSRRWAPPEDEASNGRFDDESLYNVQDKPSPALVWHGDKPPDPPPMLVEGLLPQGQIAIAAGVFSSGKTFVVGDLAACVMLNVPFAGREILRPGAVLWLAAEGANEVDARITAAGRARVGDGELPALPFARQAFDVPKLTAPSALADLTALADTFKAGLAERFVGTELTMIVIDTLGSAAGFIDGNSSAEAQRVMDLLRKLNVATGALVLLVDHFGKAVETGVMGASAKAQSADAVLGILADKTVEGEITNRRMAVAKLRGGAGGAVTPFKLRQVLAGGFGGTTCVVDWAAEPVDVATGKPKADRSAWLGKARILKSAIEVSIIDHGINKRPFGAEGPEVKAVDRERVRTEFYASYTAENAEAKRRAFNRMLDQAVASRLVAARELNGVDWLWFVQGGREPPNGTDRQPL